MASTKADNNREAWQYIDDLATTYRVSSKTVYTSDVTDGAKYGGAQDDGESNHLPKGFKMRVVKVKAASGKTFWIPVYSTSATLWTTIGTEVTRNVNGVDEVCTRVPGRRSEQTPRWMAGITQQS